MSLAERELLRLELAKTRMQKFWDDFERLLEREEEDPLSKQIYEAAREQGLPTSDLKHTKRRRSILLQGLRERQDPKYYERVKDTFLHGVPDLDASRALEQARDFLLMPHLWEFATGKRGQGEEDQLNLAACLLDHAFSPPPRPRPVPVREELPAVVVPQEQALARQSSQHLLGRSVKLWGSGLLLAGWVFSGFQIIYLACLTVFWLAQYCLWTGRAGGGEPLKELPVSTPSVRVEVGPDGRQYNQQALSISEKVDRVSEKLRQMQHELQGAGDLDWRWCRVCRGILVKNDSSACKACSGQGRHLVPISEAPHESLKALRRRLWRQTQR